MFTETNKLDFQIMDLRIELNEYRRTADNSLSEMRIYAPMLILKISSVCRAFLDRTAFESEDLFEFVELQNSLAVIFKRDIVSQNLGKLGVLRRIKKFKNFSLKVLSNRND